MSDAAAAVENRPAPRRGWGAALLGLFVAGLGQFYAGRPWRGLLWFVGFWLTVVVSELLLLNLDGAPLNVILSFVLVIGVFAAAVVDAVRVARRSQSRPGSDRWYGCLALTLVPVVLWGVQPALTRALKYVARPFEMPTSSMQDAVLIGDEILVSTRAYSNSRPERWDVVAYMKGGDPDDCHIRRVVALPGETVEIRSKVLLINGAPIPDPHAIHFDPETAVPRTSINYDSLMNRRDNFPPFTIPAGSYFLLGDNRDNSLDSRFQGPVRAEHVIGRVRRIYWSINPQTNKVRWSRVGLSVR